MPYFKVKEESGTKKLVDYSMPPVLDASEVGYDNGTVEEELDEINSNLTSIITTRLVTTETKTFSANGVASMFGDIPTVTGYTPIGIVQMMVGDASIVPLEWTVNSGTMKANIYAYNTTSSSISTFTRATILYIKS